MKRNIPHSTHKLHVDYITFLKRTAKDQGVLSLELYPMPMRTCNVHYSFLLQTVFLHKWLYKDSATMKWMGRSLRPHLISSFVGLSRKNVHFFYFTNIDTVFIINEIMNITMLLTILIAIKKWKSGENGGTNDCLIGD